MSDECIVSTIHRLRFVQVFEELLLDADWSVNAGSWMWLSCSSFFQQFFHCYCPVGFGRRTDPNGDYIRSVSFFMPNWLNVYCAKVITIRFTSHTQRWIWIYHPGAALSNSNTFLDLSMLFYWTFHHSLLVFGLFFFIPYFPVIFSVLACRRYLPLLRGFPAKYIYDPWNAPEEVQKTAKCMIGVHYPKPIVNHAEASRVNIERMKHIYQKLTCCTGLGKDMSQVLMLEIYILCLTFWSVLVIPAISLNPCEDSEMRPYLMHKRLPAYYARERSFLILWKT